MNNISFAHPQYLYLWLLLIPLIAWYIWKHKEKDASIRISGLQGFASFKPGFKHYLRHILFAFKIIAIALVIIVFARPQSTENWQERTTEGIDVVLAMDISGSMLARDFQPNRLEASKDIAIEFISGRPNDRIGLVVFGGESFTQCPLTTDHAVVINLFKDIESGMLKDGTAIGEGLATAVNRLKDSNAESKVIILLTDGVNNQGSIAPVTAAEIANTFGIRVYTIGVGSMGTAPYPFNTPYGTQFRDVKVEIDEAVLQEIAQMTDGEYFRATDNQKLRNIYQEIDQLEKSKIEVKKYSRKEEEYLPFALGAVLLIVLEILLRIFVLRKIP